MHVPKQVPNGGVTLYKRISLRDVLHDTYLLKHQTRRPRTVRTL